MSRRRGRFALRSSVVAGLVALAAFPATAPAENNPSDPNPLSTNVPYLAWRGEHVRLVKCTGDLPGAEADAIRAADTRAGDGIWLPEVNADVLVEDWSGPAAFQPQVARGTIDLFLSSDGLCIKADVISQKAGLAQVKLVVTLDPAHRDSTIADILTRSEILGVHQFLVGWMALDGPALTELPVGGDAGHLNNFVASDDPRDDGVLRVAVTGTIPLGNNFSELGLGESITLPADWPRLAGAMASDRNPDNADPAYRWDIHDDQALTEGHPAYGFPCNREAPTAPVTATYGDAVDNCEGGSAFSRFFDADGPAGPLQPISLALTTPDSIGPFDPQRPDETFLPDGFLTASDAPMPAARIDVSIAPNAGGDDLDGLGSLHRTDKQGLYSRDRAPLANSGSGSGRPHNLYAPFYGAWIPATASSGWSLLGDPVSGTDGPPQGNDFPGFLVGDGLGGEGDWADHDNLYNYWDIAHVFRSAQGQDTTCLHRADARYPYRQTPDGPQSVAVYTDEHGEALVNYSAGTGAFYDQLPAVHNANGGCDLKGIDVLGHSVIQAAARYPYQPTTDVAPKLSEPVTKTVHSGFAKFLVAFPKGAGADNANARIVVAHAQDVDGRPERGEVVCFVNTSGHGSVAPYVYDGFNQRRFGPYDVSDSAPAEDEHHHDAVCMTTNAYGNAAVEVFESEQGKVDIVGYFTAERLLRDLLVDFAPPPAPEPVIAPPADANGNTAPAAAQSARALEAVGARKAPLRRARVRVRFVRLTTSASGRRALVVRLDGRGKARVRIRLFNARGRAVISVTRTLRAGRTVRITNLRITRALTRASVKVIG